MQQMNFFLGFFCSIYQIKMLCPKNGGEKEFMIVKYLFGFSFWNMIRKIDS